MNQARLAAFAALFVALHGAPARAADPDPRDAELERLYQAVDKLEKRIDDLESARPSSGYASGGGAGPGSWADRVRISGSTSLDYSRARAPTACTTTAR